MLGLGHRRGRKFREQPALAHRAAGDALKVAVHRGHGPYVTAGLPASIMASMPPPRCSQAAPDRAGERPLAVISQDVVPEK
jgi:hypothetical protein